MHDTGLPRHGWWCRICLEDVRTFPSAALPENFCLCSSLHFDSRGSEFTEATNVEISSVLEGPKVCNVFSQVWLPS